MLQMLVALLCCFPAANSCLQCDSRVRLLFEDLVLSAPTVAEQIEIKMICDHAYVTYRETSLERMGVTGEINLGKIMKPTYHLLSYLHVKPIMLFT